MAADGSKPDDPLSKLRITPKPENAPMGDASIHASANAEARQKAVEDARDRQLARSIPAWNYCVGLAAKLDPSAVTTMGVWAWIRGVSATDRPLALESSGFLTNVPRIYSEDSGDLEELGTTNSSDDLRGLRLKARWIANSAARTSRIPVCLIHLRSGNLLPPSDVAMPVPSSELDVSALSHLPEVLVSLRSRADYRVILDIDERFQQLVRLSPNNSIFPSRGAALWTPEGLSESRHEVQTAVKSVTRDFIVIFTTVSKSCERKWMRDPQAKNLVSTASEFLDANQLDATTGLPSDARGALRDIVELWETPRGVVKHRLEAAIRALAQVEYPTYEDKRRVTDEITSAMDRWGFVAIAPATGVPSYLRCRLTSDHPKGFFYFVPLPDAKQLCEARENVKRNPVALPVFELTDFPPSRPESKQNT